MRRSALVLVLSPAFAMALSVCSAEAQLPAYRVVKTVALGTPDRWDYVVVDSPSHRVYVSHGDQVAVVDARDGTILGKVEGMKGGTHGIGISAVTGKGYTDDGQAGEAVAFDLKTFKTGAHIKADADADGIAYDPTSGHVFVVDGEPGKLTVIDPRTDRAITDIALGGKLEYAVAGNNGKLYVNGEANKEIVRVDTASNTVDAHWANPRCTSPHGLAIDTASHRLFVSCANAVLTVMNADNGAVMATLPIGEGSDGAQFDPKRKLAFSSNYDGTVTVIAEKSASDFVVLGNIKTQTTGKNMGIDQATGRLYIVVADIDPTVPLPVGRGGRAGRAIPIAGSVKLLFLDPAN